MVYRERQVRRFSPGPGPPLDKPLWKHDVVQVGVPNAQGNAVIIELGGGGAAGAAAGSGVTVTNKNTVTTLTTVTPAAGALVTAPPALATGGAGVPAVNAGLNATTTKAAGAMAGTATGAPLAPTAPPAGALPITAGAARIVEGSGKGLMGSVAMLLLTGVAGAMVMA
ncbi:hypothetical protein PG994_006450 [Apiospora phragmitis]|uniref:Uncharacterized protein n=1 Tax=Apiospora phragmitis TaxID=2905665 RepID=A0ABR1VF27_9PEZI